MSEFGSSLKVEQPFIPSADPAGDFARNVSRVRNEGVIRIYAGLARTEIWNDAKVINSLRASAYEKGAVIKVQAGPFLLKDESGKNGLWELFQGGFLTQFRLLASRGAVGTFSIIEGPGDRYILSSDSPGVEQGLSDTEYANRRYHAPWAWQQMAIKERNYFDVIDSGTVLSGSVDQMPPVMLSWRELQFLKHYASHNEVFTLKYANIEKIQAVLKKMPNS